MSARPISLVLVDDDECFRQALRDLFAFRGHTVLGEAGCAASARSLVERCAPELVMVDVCLGGESGPELANVLTRGRPDLAVVLMSATDLPDAEEVVCATGARAFVEKSRLLKADLGAFLS